jgi:outer membrane protein OmpA-like peptidoglycan-associated protein
MSKKSINGSSQTFTVHMAYLKIRKLAACVFAFAVFSCTAALGQQQKSPPVFEVFFVSGASTLPSSGLKELTSAAASIQRLSPRQVVIVGYADAVGNEADNLALSRRRAEYVFQRLKALGVPASIISVDWKGEFERALSTGEETPEPADRRVTISLHE